MRKNFSSNRQSSPIVYFAAILAFLLSSVIPSNSSAADEDDILFMILPIIAKQKPAPPPAPVGELTTTLSGDRLFVSSSKAPTWKVEFAVGSGAPGGGTGISLFLPADDSRSTVEPVPGRACCSGLGLDNLEWRWRPWGKTNGTRASVGFSSSVSSFQIVENTPQKLVFKVNGSWPGVSQFTRTTMVTPDGYTTTLDAQYSGTTGEDSMWWVIALFHPDKMNGDGVTVSDEDSAPVRLNYTSGGMRELPSDISLPYRFNYPLITANNDSIYLKVHHLAETEGNPYRYEFFDVGEPVGNYHLVYPRWIGSFAAITYHFEWEWRFTPDD